MLLYLCCSSVLGAHTHRVREEVAGWLRGLGPSLRQADTAGGPSIFCR